MIIVVAVVTALLVFVVAAVAIGRETHRLDAMPPAPPFGIHEAVDWVAERLPEDVRAEITYEDVRDVILWHLDDVSAEGDRAASAEGAPFVVSEEASVDALTLRALASGRDIDPSHIRAILDGELAYLQAIGAVGPPADGLGG